MANENKLLGTLQLNAGGVLQTINRVNEALKKLGEGVDLDLTKIVNTKVSSQLADLQKQINEIGNATRRAASSTNQDAQQLQRAINLYVEIAQISTKIARQGPTNALVNDAKQKQGELDGILEKMTASTKAAYNTQIQSSDRVQRAMRNYSDAVERANAKVIQASEEASAKQQASSSKALNAKIAAVAKEEAAVVRLAAAEEKAAQKTEQATQREIAAQQRRMKAAQTQLYQMADRAVIFMGRYLIQALRTQWSAAVSYVNEYYDALNMIRVITGKTAEEANQLGRQYRQMAQEMSVLSTELAQAATTFYRQGLTDEQVNTRLEWVTKYAKVANLDFSRAAELITATTNAMSADIQDNVQRVVDVFLYLGDAAATSGEEVGVAMQKASASATEFGISFEWLGSYIATVSEQTRQAPETIGNAFNSMMARMHQIRETGYNSEDETRINNVAKALNAVDVALFDQSGEWRKMSDIFSDVAAKWNTMTDKQKAYIATTVAGTRQQNVFFALMNDLSKGIEGGSRAWELYAGAMDAAGTATEKYATWQESLAAAQANLQNSLEGLYASVSSGVLKGFYDIMAGIVDALAKGTEIAHGLNIVFAVLIGTVGALGVAFWAFRKALLATNGTIKVTQVLLAMFEKHPIIMAISAAVVVIGTLTGIIGWFGSALDSTADKTDAYTDSLNKMNETASKIENIKSLQESVGKTFDKMQNGVRLTDEEVIEYNKNLNELAEISPGAKRAVDDLKNSVGDQKEAFEQLNTVVDETIKKMSEEEQAFARTALRSYSAPRGTTYANSYQSDLDRLVAIGQTDGWNIDNWQDTETVLRRAILGASFDDAHIDYKLISQEMKDTVNAAWQEFKQIDDYKNYIAAKLYTDDEAWGAFYDILYLKLFGGENSEKQIEARIESEKQHLLQTAERSIGGFANELEREVVFSKWGSQIIDNNGFLVDNAADVLLRATEEYVAPTAQQMVVYIAKQFGKNAGNINNFMSLDDDTENEMSEAIVEHYVSMLMSGFTSQRIKSIIQSYIDKHGGSAISVLQTQMDAALSEAVGGFSDDSKGWDLDYTSQNLILELYDLGKSKEEIDRIFANSNSLEEFNQNLKNLRDGMISVDDVTEDFAKSIDALQKDIDAVQKLTDKLDKGETVTLSDLWDLKDTHPELVLLIKDTKALKAALEEIKKQDNEKIKDALVGWMKDSAEVAQNSEWADRLTDTITTLGILQGTLDQNNPEDMDVFTAIDAWLNQIAQDAVTAKAAVQGLTSSDYISKLDSSQSNLETVREYRQILDQGGSLSWDQMVDLGKINPKLMAAYGDMRLLRDLLKTEEQNILDDQKEFWEGYVANTSYYMTGQAFQWKNEYGVNTLQEAMNLFGSDEFIAQNGKAQADTLFTKAKSMVANYAKALMESYQATSKNTEELTKFEQLLEKITNLNKAKGALDIIRHPESNDVDKVADAWKTIFEIFPNLKQDGTASVDDVKNAVDGLDASARQAAKGFGELGEGIIASMDRGSEAIQRLDDKYVNSFLATASNADIESYVNKYFSGGNVDWNNRPKVSVEAMNKAGYDFNAGDYATKYGVSTATYVGDKAYAILVTPILPNGQVLSPNELDGYIDEVTTKATEMGISILEADLPENGGKGLVYFQQQVEAAENAEDAIDEALEKAGEYDRALSQLQAQYFWNRVKEYGSQAAQEIDIAAQKAEGFKDVIQNMRDEKYSDFALMHFVKMTDAEQTAFVDMYPELTAAIGQLGQAYSEMNLLQSGWVDATEEDWVAAEQAIQEAEDAFYQALDNIDIKASNTVVTIDGLTSGISRLKAGNQLLKQATEEMKSGKGLTLETASGIIGQLTDRESLTDYLIVQNGVLELNVKAWQNRNTALLESQRQNALQKIAELDGQISETLPWEREELMALRAEYEEQVEVLNAVIEGLNETGNQEGKTEEKTLSLTEALNALSSAAKFLTDVQNGNGGLIEMINSAVSLASNVKNFDWTSFVKGVSTENGWDIVWDTDAVRAFTDSLVNQIPNIKELEKRYEGITQALKDMVAAEVEAKNQLEAFTKAFSSLKSGNDIMRTAMTEMAGGKGLTGSTALKIIGDLQPGEKITDYLRAENGLLELNTEAWNNRTRAQINNERINLVNEISKIDQQIAELEDEKARGHTEEIRELEETKSELEGTIVVLDATADALDHVGDSTDDASKSLEKFSNLLSAIQSTSSFLTDIQKGEKSPIEMIQSAMSLASLKKGTSWTDFLMGGGQGWNSETGFAWNTEGIRAFIDSLIEQDEELKKLAETYPEVIDWLKGLAEAEAEAKEKSVTLSDALGRLKSGTDILKTATEEMKGGNGISLGTLSSIVGQLGEGERLSNYLTATHNGIELNTDAWKARSMALVENQKAEIDVQKNALITKGTLSDEEKALLTSLKRESAILGKVIQTMGEYNEETEETAKATFTLSQALDAMSSAYALWNKAGKGNYSIIDLIKEADSIASSLGGNASWLDFVKDFDVAGRTIVWDRTAMQGAIEQVILQSEAVAELEKKFAGATKVIRGFIRSETALSEYKSLQTNMEFFQEVLEDLGAGKTLTVEQALGIAEYDSSLLAYVGYMDLFVAKVEETRAKLEKDQRDTLAAMIAMDPTYFGWTQQTRDWQRYYGVNTFAEANNLAKEQGWGFTSVNEEANLIIDMLWEALHPPKQTGEPTELEKFVQDIEDLSKAKSALDTITHAEEHSATEVASAWKTVMEVFEGIDEHSTIEDVQEKTEGLQQTVEETADSFGEMGQTIVQSMTEGASALSEMAQKIRDEFGLSEASDNGFQAQIDALNQAMAEGGIAKAVEVWGQFGEEMQNAIAEQFPSLVVALDDASKATDDLDGSLDNVNRELKSITKNNATRYFKNTAQSISGLTNNATKAADAYASFYSEAEKAVTAQSEYLTATDKLADGVELASDDVETLSEFLGFVTPDALLQNWDQVGPMLAAAIGEGTDALNRLNEAAFINITGVSSADFSNIMNGLLAVQDEAEATVQALLATGQWTIEEQDVDQSMPIWFMSNGQISYVDAHATAKYKLLKPTGANPFKGAKSSYAKGNGSSGGGGGGGGGSSKGMTEVQRMLDRMAQIQAIQNHTKSLYSAQASLFSETGQLQGVIAYYEKERAAIEHQNETLRANIAEMEPWIEKKRAEVAALKVTDEAYEEAANDLKSLQERHQEYTLALINNTAEVDKLTDSIKEQRDAIRQMEIDLRNTILEAIKDREALAKEMLSGLVETENTILDLIKKRYEKERDMILENTDRQIDALQKERDLLSEQLELRKQQAEEEDKLAKLAELEAKYARISADPTRRKEALSIQKEITDLRDEMAWDLAEKEVQAQQDSIDQQIDSLSDYKEYISNYYEYLFEHPQQLIEEMQGIIQGTNEEIIAWLEANDEEFAKSTEATKQTTINSWTEMLNTMRGELELYWDEVEEIIAGGDDFIVNFLIENSAKYREAGKLQAEAYVDEWRKQLDDLAKAYEQVTGAEPDDYIYIAPAEGSSSGGDGGGDGNGTDLTTSPTKTVSLLSMADITGKSLATGNGPIDTEKKWADLGTVYWDTEGSTLIQKALNNSTLVQTPSMPNIGDTVNNNGSQVTFGDIIVNVDSLQSDGDFDEFVKQFEDKMTNYMNRGSPVGGIRHAKSP